MEDQGLATNEDLGRTSPELWPDQSIFSFIFLSVGVSEFIATRQPDLNIQTPSKYRTDLDKEDLELIHGSFAVNNLFFRFWKFIYATVDGQN